MRTTATVLAWMLLIIGILVWTRGNPGSIWQVYAIIAFGPGLLVVGIVIFVVLNLTRNKKNDKWNDAKFRRLK